MQGWRLKELEGGLGGEVRTWPRVGEGWSGHAVGIPLPLELGKLEQRWAFHSKGMSEGSLGSEGGIGYRPKWGSAKRNSQIGLAFS